MAKLLGTAYEVGKTDAVVSRRPAGAVALEEGLFIKQVADGEFSLAQGVAPFGVVAEQGSLACGIVISGLKVAVQLDDGIVPVLGGIVYVSAITDKATDTDNALANVATAATFTGITGTDGRSDNTATKKTTVRWAEINMANGL